jgi:hypothetical protein
VFVTVTIAPALEPLRFTGTCGAAALTALLAPSGTATVEVWASIPAREQSISTNEKAIYFILVMRGTPFIEVATLETLYIKISLMPHEMKRQPLAALSFDKR